jgi:lipoyl(octanoyl) transferase
MKLSLKEYVHLLEESIIQTIAHYGIKGTRLQGATGVWLDIDKPSIRKICAIGIRASHYVTMHGFALNVTTDLNYFHYINPCGFVDKGVTSLEKELNHPLDMQEVKEVYKKSFTDIFKQ